MENKLTPKHQALYDAWLKRDYSWSQHSCYGYSQDQWFTQYILNIRGSSAQMEFGNVVGDSLGTANPLVKMPVLSHKEFEIRAKLDKLKLVGFLDFFEDTPEIQENKTSSNPDKWNQGSVDTHGQLTYYCMLLYLPHTAGCKDIPDWNCKAGCVRGKLKKHKSLKPEDITIKLYYIPVHQDSFFEMHVTKGKKVQVFHTKRTLKQVYHLMVEIRKRRKEMEKYAMKRLLALQHAS